MKDKIKIRILEDGMIVAETGKISMRSHISADDILKELTDLMGGLEKIESTRTNNHHHHHHNEGHHEH